jgi:hypothetical protein
MSLSVSSFLILDVFIRISVILDLMKCLKMTLKFHFINIIVFIILLSKPPNAFLNLLEIFYSPVFDFVEYRLDSHHVS